MSVKYRLHYTKESQLFPNFGIGNWKVPMRVNREYEKEEDEHVMSLSNPQATRIEKQVDGGEWQQIYPKEGGNT